MVVLSGRGPGRVDSPAQLSILWVGMRKVAFRISVDRAKVTLANEQCFKTGKQSPQFLHCQQRALLKMRKQSHLSVHAQCLNWNASRHRFY